MHAHAETHIKRRHTLLSCRHDSLAMRWVVLPTVVGFNRRQNLDDCAAAGSGRRRANTTHWHPKDLHHMTAVGAQNSFRDLATESGGDEVGLGREGKRRGDKKGVTTQSTKRGATVACVSTTWRRGTINTGELNKKCHLDERYVAAVDCSSCNKFVRCGGRRFLAASTEGRRSIKMSVK